MLLRGCVKITTVISERDKCKIAELHNSHRRPTYGPVILNKCLTMRARAFVESTIQIDCECRI